MTTKLWGGRFAGKTHSKVDAFNASIHFDYKLWPYDIAGSLAHLAMLAEQSILTKNEAHKIEQALEAISRDIENGNFEWKIDQEDVHLNIEAELIRRIGPLGGKLHTARSRNDQVALDLRLYSREQVKAIQRAIRKFQKSLVDQAAKHLETILPGYTHLQRAQPVLLAHHLLAYFEMAERDFERLSDLQKRIETLPLGAGALAGTTFPIDRRHVAKALGFKRIAQNSLDAVSDRDFVVELIAACALIAVHLSRFAEELILWSGQEFGFAKLPEQFCTGSSMMPQKMNPDVLELIRGKTGRSFGHLISLLTTLKGLPLAYNKDMQEDKEPLFDTIQTTLDCLDLFQELLSQTEFQKEAMLRATREGFLLATDLADYLADKGLPFRDAHHVVGRIVRFCQEQATLLEELSLETLQSFSKLIGPDVKDWLSLSKSIERRKSEGGTARSEVKKQLKKAASLLEKAEF